MKKLKYAWLSCLCFLFNANMYAYATSAGNEAADALMDLLDLLMGFVQGAGFVVFAFGLGKMILAFKDDNADSKAKSSMVLMGGLFCIVIKPILIVLGALPG